MSEEQLRPQDVERFRAELNNSAQRELDWLRKEAKASGVVQDCRCRAAAIKAASKIVAWRVGAQPQLLDDATAFLRKVFS